MNARDRIGYFLDRWFQLTHLESQAIQNGDWARLTNVQTAKSALRQPLREALDEWKNGNRIAGSADEGHPFFRSAVDHLLELEARNLELLAVRKESCLDRQRLIEQAARTLRQVRHSYAPAPARAWQAYS